MGLSKQEYVKVLRTGNALNFKRAMKHHKLNGQIIEPCRNYQKLKKMLKITGW